MSFGKFVEAMDALPDLPFDPAPWYIAKSGVSVDTEQVSGARIRQEAGKGQGFSARTKANARIIAAAPTNYNLLQETLYAMVILSPEPEGRHPHVSHIMELTCDAIAWMHNDPLQGAGLRMALGIVQRAEDEGQRPQYSEVKKAAKKRSSKIE